MSNVEKCLHLLHGVRVAAKGCLPRDRQLGVLHVCCGVASFDANALREDGVVKQAAHAADFHFGGAAVAPNALLRLPVDAAESALIVVPLYPDIAILAPFRTPRVLDEPVLAACVLAVALREHRVAQHRIPCAVVEDAAVIIEPVVRIHGHHNGALLDKRTHQRLCLVAGQGMPATDADAALARQCLSRCRGLASLRLAEVGHVGLQRDAVVPHEGIG
mmetsp:Transcript_120435/g.269240  ORF Transcript_120435/g.269240 Transcript_120435/m.269240 type:complete len:218 (+) Transcript_120435:163-816(+)